MSAPEADADTAWEAAYGAVIRASRADRRDLFLTTAACLGTPLGNVEKDFWVCWTLAALFRARMPGDPRLLFKGGTSLSKAYGLIERFSEDVDATVFRDDLAQPASVDALAALSGKKRLARITAIRDACRAYVTGPLRTALAAPVADATDGAGQVTVDSADPDGQTLLVAYPAVEAATDADPCVRPVVRIESGAKSALDPHRVVTVRPYVADNLPSLALAVSGVLTIEPTRTFWDKVVIAHGLRRWYERRGVLRQGASACPATTTTCTACCRRTSGRRHWQTKHLGRTVPGYSKSNGVRMPSSRVPSAATTSTGRSLDTSRTTAVIDASGRQTCASCRVSPPVAIA